MLEIKDSSSAGIVIYSIGEYNINCEDMGKHTLTANISLPISYFGGTEIPNEFKTSYYVEYNNDIYFLNSVKPTGVKDNVNQLIKYTLVFESKRNKLDNVNLKNVTYVYGRDANGNADLTTQTLGIEFTSAPSFFGNIYDFVWFIRKNLEYLFGLNNINIKIDGVVADYSVEALDTSRSKSNTYSLPDLSASILQALINFNETSKYRFDFEYDNVNNIYWIVLDKTPTTIGKTFEYGGITPDGALLSITRSTNEQIMPNRIYGVGGNVNLPVNYYGIKENIDSSDNVEVVSAMPATPDINKIYVIPDSVHNFAYNTWIYSNGVWSMTSPYYQERIAPYPKYMSYYPNLMPKCFREYLQGWTDGYNGVTYTPPPPTFTPQYWEGYSDGVNGLYKPITYYQNDDDVDVYGIKETTVNFDDIYPSIVEMYAEDNGVELGRLDEVVDVYIPPAGKYWEDNDNIMYSTKNGQRTNIKVPFINTPVLPITTTDTLPYGQTVNAGYILLPHYTHNWWTWINDFNLTKTIVVTNVSKSKPLFKINVSETSDFNCLSNNKFEGEFYIQVYAYVKKGANGTDELLARKVLKVKVKSGYKVTYEQEEYVLGLLAYGYDSTFAYHEILGYPDLRAALRHSDGVLSLQRWTQGSPNSWVDLGVVPKSDYFNIDYIDNDYLDGTYDVTENDTYTITTKGQIKTLSFTPAPNLNNNNSRLYFNNFTIRTKLYENFDYTKKSFFIWTKNLFFDISNPRWNGGNLPYISFTKGKLAGFKFQLCKEHSSGEENGVFLSNSKSISTKDKDGNNISVNSYYCIELSLYESTPSEETSNQVLFSEAPQAPNLVPEAGDIFIIEGVRYPYDPYVFYAEQKLEDALIEELNKESRYTYNIVLDHVALSNQGIDYNQLKAGYKIKIKNTTLVGTTGNNYAEFFIKSVQISKTNDQHLDRYILNVSNLTYKADYRRSKLPEPNFDRDVLIKGFNQLNDTIGILKGDIQLNNINTTTIANKVGAVPSGVNVNDVIGQVNPIKTIFGENSSLEGDVIVSTKIANIAKKIVNTKNKKLNTLLDFRDNSVLGFFSYDIEVIVSVEPDIVISDNILYLESQIFMFEYSEKYYYNLEPQAIDLIPNEVNYIYVKGQEFEKDATLYASTELMPYELMEDKFYLVGYVNPTIDEEQTIEYVYIGDRKLSSDVIKPTPIPVNSEDRYKYINHRLGRKPDVQLIDESGEVRYVQVIHLSDDSLQLSWVGSIAGSVIIE